MRIRTKLTLQFLALSAIVLLISSAAIFIFSTNYRVEEFYRRLHDKANSTAKLLIDVNEIDAEKIRHIEQINPTGLPSEKVIILDFKNTKLFTNDSTGIIHYDRYLITRILKLREVNFRQGDYEGAGWLYTINGKQFIIIAAAIDYYGLRKIVNLERILGIVAVLGLLLLLSAGWFYAGRALRPISGIIEDVNKISAQNLNLRLKEGKNKDELEQLAHTFNNMLNKLEASFAIQKSFISNASHELRTPLTVITGQIEYALLNKRTTKEHLEILKSIYEDVKKMNALTNSLLTLAQTDGKMDTTSFAKIRLDEVIWVAYEELVATQPGYSVDIMMNEDLNDENMTIRGDENLVKTAFLNLMDNGCKYSGDHTVTVKMDYIEGGVVQMDFADRGVGIPEEEITQLTKPFYRGSNRMYSPGQGIGLSLVERVIALHHGTLEITSELGKGTTVTLKFHALV